MKVLVIAIYTSLFPLLASLYTGRRDSQLKCKGKRHDKNKEIIENKFSCRNPNILLSLATKPIGFGDDINPFDLQLTDEGNYVVGVDLDFDAPLSSLPQLNAWRQFETSSVSTVTDENSQLNSDRNKTRQSTWLNRQSNILRGIFQILQKFEGEKEESRRLRRTVFTSQDWVKHRSSSRYFRELYRMPRSRVLRGLMKQSLIVSLFSCLLVSYNMLIEVGRLPSWLPLLKFPPLPFTLTSSSLGLLLVFRTNSAYARWREARANWSSISAKSFDLIRQSVSWIPDKVAVAKIIRHVVAFGRCLKWSLGNKKNIKRLQEDLTGVLSEAEISDVLVAKMKPQFVLLKLTKIISEQNLFQNIQSHLDRALIELSQQAENCDRIFTTPIPLVYTRLTARFLLLWLGTFPLSLYNEFNASQKLFVPFITFINSMFMMGIDDLGVQIEEPFSILPLANICYQIQSSANMTLSVEGIQWFEGVDTFISPDR